MCDICDGLPGCPVCDKEPAMIELNEQTMDIDDLIEYALDKCSNHSDLKEEIEDIVELCQDEIEEGGSPTHEIESAIQAIDNLIKE